MNGIYDCIDFIDSLTFLMKEWMNEWRMIEQISLFQRMSDCKLCMVE